MRYTSDLKEVKEFGLAKSVLYNFVLSIFITLALAVIAIYAMGLRLDIVLSDSMSPVFFKDDMVIIRAFDDYKVGDIIEYQLSDVSKPVTHRIVAKEGVGKNAKFETQGDASGSSEKYIPFSAVKGKVIMIINNGGTIYKAVKDNYFLFIDILLGLWVLSSTLSNESEMRRHDIAKV